MTTSPAAASRAVLSMQNVPLKHYRLVHIFNPLPRRYPGIFCGPTNLACKNHHQEETPWVDGLNTAVPTDEGNVTAAENTEDENAVSVT